jgi:hypothetical protein
MGRHWGLIHQYQGGRDASADCPPVDCPPSDWWLFLFHGGIDLASPGGESVHALIGQVGRWPYWELSGLMLDVWCLTSAISGAVDDVKEVSRMGRVAAARHLSQIAAECLEKRTP